MRNEIIKIADQNVPAFIYGETGTGKEMVASALHLASSRRNFNFVEVNCGSIPENILESEMFGYKKGAFTDASKDHKGKIELADKGIFFLDEIENLTFSQQAKLLRVLEDKKVYPIGSNEGKVVDFRLICATNVDLNKMVEEGRFREDLYYRINVYLIELPPLRERGDEEISLLIRHFLWENNSITIDNDAIELLQKYSWPGNVRELKNLLKKFTIIAQGNNENSINYEIVKEGFRKFGNKDKLKEILNKILEYSNGNISNIVHSIEDMAVLNAYKEFNGNISKIAQKVFKENPDDKRNYRDKVRAILDRNKDYLQ